MQGSTLLGRCSAANGVWQIDVDVSDVENITATLTDLVGNTSPFAVYGSLSGGLDSNGTGISDALYTLAGIDPQSPSETPIAAGAVVVDKISVGLNFASKKNDTLTATLRLILPAGYTNKGAMAALQFADYTARFTPLDSKGNGPKGNATLKLMGAWTTPGPQTVGLLQFSVKKTDLQSGLASSSLIEKTTTGKTGEQDTIPVAVAIGMAGGAKYVYVGSVNVLYKAVQKKAGKASKAK